MKYAVAGCPIASPSLRGRPITVVLSAGPGDIRAGRAIDLRFGLPSRLHSREQTQSHPVYHWSGGMIERLQSAERRHLNRPGATRRQSIVRAPAYARFPVAGT